MALGQSLRNGIGTLWRGVLSAVEAGQSVFQTAQRTTEAVIAAGLPPQVIDTQVMDQLAGMAGSWVNARDTLSSAADSDPIDSSMVTLAPWSMDLNSFNASPSYHLVIGINVEGQEQPVYRTITGIDQLPASVGELRSAQLINAYALGVGTNPGGGVGGTVTGVDSITITVGPALG